MVMPSGNVHRAVAAVIVGGTFAIHESQSGKATAKPVVAGSLAAALANLPDRLEPAIHPNHRQFFHSLTAALLVGCAGYKLYKWQPTEDWQQVVRLAALVACGAYVLHLAADSLTKNSIPLLGRS